jgi:hypothetical protein
MLTSNALSEILSTLNPQMAMFGRCFSGRSTTGSMGTSRRPPNLATQMVRERDTVDIFKLLNVHYCIPNTATSISHDPSCLLTFRCTGEGASRWPISSRATEKNGFYQLHTKVNWRRYEYVLDAFVAFYDHNRGADGSEYCWIPTR